MKLSRFLSGLAPALAIAALIGFAAPAPTLAQQASPTPAPSAALLRARGFRHSGAGRDARA